MNIPFEKLVGAGNDFIFVWEADLKLKIDRPHAALIFCDRQFGIGADGLAIISPVNESENHFAWDFYNRDGSNAEMCGNAARCAIRFINCSKNISSCKFDTKAGLVSGQITDFGAEVSWTLQSEKSKELTVDLENFKSFSGLYINTGVPHFVISNELSTITVEDCLAIQSHPSFGEKQTNVTLLDTDENGLHLTKTFERGVKNFTLACGTGVIASAFVLQNQKPSHFYKLQTPGGALEVKLDGANVTLIGPAERVFTGTLLPNEVSHD